MKVYLFNELTAVTKYHYDNHFSFLLIPHIFNQINFTEKLFHIPI